MTWNPTTTVSDTTAAANFIPELWSDEVVAAYKANLVMAGLVTRFNHVGKKGDTFHLPAPGRLSASAMDMTNPTEVAVSIAASSDISISLDKQYYVAQLFTDAASIQALDSMRQHHTDDYGYALATQVDTDLLALYAGLQGGAEVIGGDGITAWSTTANSNTGNGTALTDAGIRRMMQTLDDANIPQGNRAIVIPPVAKNTLLGLPRFTEQAFTGEARSSNSIRNGRIGDIYGMGVYVSTNCPQVLAADASTAYRVGMMFHKSALALVEQQSVTVEMERKLEWMGDLLVAHTIYGVGELRDDAGVAFIIPE